MWFLVNSTHEKICNPHYHQDQYARTVSRLVVLLSFLELWYKIPPDNFVEGLRFKAFIIQLFVLSFVVLVLHFPSNCPWKHCCSRVLAKSIRHFVKFSLRHPELAFDWLSVRFFVHWSIRMHALLTFLHLRWFPANLILRITLRLRRWQQRPLFQLKSF